MKIQRCKGMRDLSPAEMKVFRYLQGIYRDSFIKWGYQEVMTPTIEYLHLFTSAGTLTPGMIGKVYSFLDWDGWSGERVVLRPDGTIPVARMYTQEMQGLARLYYTANVFRFEEGAARNRERWQCGAEIIGAGSAVADAELVALSLEILGKLGVNTEIRLSHAGIIKVLLARLGLSEDEQHKVFDRILDGDIKALTDISRKSPELGNSLLPLLSPKGQSPDFLQSQKDALCRNIPEIKGALDDFLNTLNIMDDLGIPYQVNIASGAGFEYYTGLIFQLYDGKEKIGGGGRYDELISSMGGGNTPASGFALYLDRLMKLVKPGKIGLPEGIKVTVKYAAGVAAKEAFNAAESLRQAGYIAAIGLDGSEAALVLAINASTPKFTFSKGKTKSSAATLKEAIKLLEGQGGD